MAPPYLTAFSLIDVLLMVTADAPSNIVIAPPQYGSSTVFFDKSDKSNFKVD